MEVGTGARLFLKIVNDCRSVQIQYTDSRGQPLGSCHASKSPPVLPALVKIGNPTFYRVLYIQLS